MKKIMFNDIYGLTRAVLEGRKTMTRRNIKAPRTMEGKDVYGFAIVTYKNGEVAEIMATDEDEAMINNILPKYKVGEVVAVAQGLRDMGYDARDTKHKSGAIWGLDHTAAWTNKMFVSASECVHQIRITNIRVERLQDISDEDCFREGVQAVRIPKGWVYVAGGATIHDVDRKRIWSGEMELSEKCVFDTPREAFAALIDKVTGKGTWESNPYMFVYQFELYK